MGGRLNRHTRLRLSSDHGHLRVEGDFPSAAARDEALGALVRTVGVAGITIGG